MMTKSVEQMIENFKDALLVLWNNHGYDAVINIETDPRVSMNQADLDVYYQMINELLSDQFARMIHNCALENNITDMFVFEKTLKNTISNFLLSDGCPHYITDISCYQIVSKQTESSYVPPVYIDIPSKREIAEMVRDTVAGELKKQYKDMEKHFLRIDQLDRKMKETNQSIRNMHNSLVDSISNDVKQTVESLENMLKEYALDSSVVGDFEAMRSEREKEINALLVKYSHIAVSPQLKPVLAMLSCTELKEVLVEAFERQDQEAFICDEAYRDRISYKDTKIGCFIFHSKDEHSKHTLISIQLEKSYKAKYQSLDTQNQVGTLYFNNAIVQEFKDLINAAQNELIIISPWANAYAFSVYSECIKKALERGVNILIIYGLDNTSSNSESNDRMVDTKMWIQNYEALSSTTKGSLTSIYRYLHIKGVIVDQRVMLLGSCNLLSMISQEGTNRDLCRNYTQGEVMFPIINTQAIAGMRDYCLHGWKK